MSAADDSTQRVLDAIDEELDGYVTWHGSSDSSEFRAGDFDLIETDASGLPLAKDRSVLPVPAPIPPSEYQYRDLGWINRMLDDRPERSMSVALPFRPERRPELVITSSQYQRFCAGISLYLGIVRDPSVNAELVSPPRCLGCGGPVIEVDARHETRVDPYEISVFFNEEWLPVTSSTRQYQVTRMTISPCECVLVATYE